MKKEQVVRTFKLADAVLKQKADELIALIDRDSPNLQIVAITPQKRPN